jgi:hypothetical protein|tara:strand:+ start:290 stop:442 length:153 start_codon:yes stop_codon:yes gene_type:complete
MREEKKTQVSIAIEVQGKVVTLTQSISNHDLEEASASLINAALLLESNLS